MESLVSEIHILMNPQLLQSNTWRVSLKAFIASPSFGYEASRGLLFTTERSWFRINILWSIFRRKLCMASDHSGAIFRRPFLSYLCLLYLRYNFFCRVRTFTETSLSVANTMRSKAVANPNYSMLVHTDAAPNVIWREATRRA